MKLFTALYNKVIQWAQKPQAPLYLAGLSFTEASFFPIPPDVMLVPMTLSQPERAWHFALLTTIASVLGGILGYVIGMFAFDLIKPFLEHAGYIVDYQRVHHWFVVWGAVVILLAGFTPIPYKLFTIVAGVVAMPVMIFLLASCIGRGARFFLVAAVMKWGNAYIREYFVRYIEWICWTLVAIAVLVYVGLYL